MAGSKTDEWANYTNDGLIGSLALVVPPTFYVALSSAAFDPAVLDNATGFAELSGGGYTRLAVPNDKTRWSVSGAVTARTIYNLVQLVFGGATAPWPVILSAYLATSALPNSGGKLAYGGDFGSPTGVAAGHAFVIPAGNFSVAER